jgi:ectoine hydroxylase-related dioxygenase (phytanoyl-CoA dioxygenase family)
MSQTETDGFGPVERLIGAEEVARLLDAWASFAPVAAHPGRGGPRDEDMAVRIARGEPWFKDLHFADAGVAAIGRDLASRASDLLGCAHVDLWGVTVVTKSAGQVHRLHRDVESSEAPCATIWVALENVMDDSSLLVVRGSHRYPVSPQDVRSLDSTDRAAVTAVARSYDPRAEVSSLGAMRPGFGVVLDARVWHGSALGRAAAVRRAATFQYAPRGAPVRVPLRFEPPLSFGRDAHRVPC